MKSNISALKRGTSKRCALDRMNSGENSLSIDSKRNIVSAKHSADCSEKNMPVEVAGVCPLWAANPMTVSNAPPRS